MEEWKDVKGYEGLYRVSNTGKVFSYKRMKLIKQQHQYYKNYKYLKVRLYKDGKNRFHRVHRLVANAFISNPNNYNEINHKDEDPTNNNVYNLEWCNHKYNCNYGTTQFRRQQTIKERYGWHFTNNNGTLFE